MIRYKVVINGGFSAFIGIQIECNKYRLFYKDNSIVEAPKDSIGIMVFDTLENAIKFSNSCILEYYHPEIKEVETLDKETIPKFISANLGEYSLYKFYKKELPKRALKEPPIGTICCPKIKVIKTIKGTLK